MEKNIYLEVLTEERVKMRQPGIFKSLDSLSYVPTSYIPLGKILFNFFQDIYLPL